MSGDQLIFVSGVVLGIVVGVLVGGLVGGQLMYWVITRRFYS